MALDSVDLRTVRGRQRRFVVLVGVLTVLFVGTCVWMRWTGWAIFLGLAGLALIALYLVPALVLTRELRRGSEEASARARLGERYDRLYQVVFAGLAAVDPFRGMYAPAGKQDGRDYKEYYEFDARRVLSALSELPAGSRSDDSIRETIFLTLKDNAYGNRRGGVGNVERYSELARRVRAVLTAPSQEEGD